MAERETRISNRNWEVDENNRLHIELPSGEKLVFELTDSEIYTAQNWFHLASKHPLRLEILNILQIYYELNITQISQKVEQSKSTVARHLKSMEQDCLVTSRTAQPTEYGPGKIPPKLYQRNNKLVQIVQYLIPLPPVPSEVDKLKDFYLKEINGYRGYINNLKSLFDMFHPMFDKMERNVDDLPATKKMWDNYFDEINSPVSLIMDLISFSAKYYDQFVVAYRGFFKKIIDILSIQNADPDVKAREYTALFTIMPIREFYEIYSEELQEKKKEEKKKP